MIDAEIPEVRDFIKRIAGNGCRPSGTLTHLSSHSDTIAEELLKLSTRRTIDEIRESQEEGYFVTLATIKGIDIKYRWFIETCKTCRSTVELDDKGKWVCNGKCAGYAKFVVLRYKVRVNVIDHTGNAIFVLFDSQASDLIQQSAKDLRENQLQVYTFYPNKLFARNIDYYLCLVNVLYLIYVYVYPYIITLNCTSLYHDNIN
ncbi:uncharacterized protein LOC141642557 [Silene latifolia]|uniref:uncharacterized protein LOC141642557 n=1 Tax=Silene latifolia TaxID=37657 RepID=UPI003D77A1F8